MITPVRATVTAVPAAVSVPPDRVRVTTCPATVGVWMDPLAPMMLADIGDPKVKAAGKETLAMPPAGQASSGVNWIVAVVAVPAVRLARVMEDPDRVAFRMAGPVTVPASMS